MFIVDKASYAIKFFTAESLLTPCISVWNKTMMQADPAEISNPTHVAFMGTRS